MQTLNKYGAKANRVICEFDGLSTDSKPTVSFTEPDTNATIYIDNGSVYNEIDTGKKYKYDKSTDTWYLNGGSGGGGGSAVLISKTITTNGSYNASTDHADGYSSVSVSVSDTPEAEKNDVNFYDYDGTRLYSYTANEFLALSEMPSNPSHEGLTAQGWNWSLADAKEYVEDYGKLDIGQMYITSDGKTRIYINLPEGRISPVLKLYLNANTELDIDWGDGSTHSTFTSTTADYKSERHNYSAAGDYVIAIKVTTGSFILQSSSTVVSSILWNENNNANSPDRAYNNSIHRIELGIGVGSIGRSAFFGCSSLSSITIPDSVTDIGDYALRDCYSLTSVTIPDSVTSIGSGVFYYCSALSSITIPNSATSIGTFTFQCCYSLTSVTIPDSVTSIGNYTFYYCYSLSSITIPDSVTRIHNNAFSVCSSLSSITIPNSVTSIGNYAFQNCYSLSSITIPDSVTGIDSYAFQSCSSLSSVIIGNSVTSIGGSAFESCSYVESIKFTSTTPPTVSANAFSNVPTDCKIYVPQGSLSDYTSASNYPDPNTYTYIEY